MQSQFVNIPLGNSIIENLRRKEVAAIQIADGGAMGTPGEIVIFYTENHEVYRAHGNFIYGNTDLDQLSQKLKLSLRGVDAWQEFYMGVGHLLLVNARDFPALEKELGKKPDDECLWMTHEDEICNALFAGAAPVKKRQHKPKKDKAPLENDDIMDYGFTISVYLEQDVRSTENDMSKNCREYLPDGNRIYLKEMDNTPDGLCVEKVKGWAKKICITKAHFPQLIELWYPDGTGHWNWQEIIDAFESDLIWIYGWGD